MKKYLQNEKGLTLVEVLATLVILGIVFVGIMNIFPQMTLFNAKTYTKLDTMNLARQEMADIKSNEMILSEETPLVKFTESISGIDYSSPEGPKKENEEDYYEFTKENADNGYKYELRFFTNPDFDGDINTPALHKIHLIIKKEQNILSSEIYGYVEIK
ncbi:type IV pilus modification PilV family protein [Sporosarcina sp. G11-34]|uniref:type IV pilus modification PilV family protein n=1 Tax=Sporosarcina sp. G11-34 TaxID=2849605 RepID=UPI0022A9996F|nr:prepilin-type N-terminal cleavage/methylation domain-containing protein [Sporosarcina sp. G11-34]MCZ2259810.1 prepilin-type N-terminal cleavage/methylation domain-containing protein [Sporosarcina sp. G11-34]